MCANINQFDIDLAIRRMVCVGGVDEQLYIDCNQKNDFTSAYIDEDQLSVYQLYEAALEPLKDFSDFCQSSKVIVHWKLFEAHWALERLSAPFFEMYGNLSSQNRGTSRMATDLTKEAEDASCSG